MSKTLKVYSEYLFQAAFLHYKFCYVLILYFGVLTAFMFMRVFFVKGPFLFLSDIL